MATKKKEKEKTDRGFMRASRIYVAMETGDRICHCSADTQREKWQKLIDTVPEALILHKQLESHGDEVQCGGVQEQEVV